MKKLFLSQYLMVAVFMLPLESKAQDGHEYCPSGKIPSRYKRVLVNKEPDSIDNMSNEMIRKSTSNEVMVNFILDYDTDVFDLQNIKLFGASQQYPYNIGAWGDDYSTTVVPDTYDIIAIFSTHPTLYYVILEDVEIHEDREFSISPAMATNHLSVVCHGPDGRVLKHGLGYRDPDTGEWITTENGDVVDTTVENWVIRKGGKVVYHNACSFIGDMPTEESRTLPELDFYVNDVSDRYLFVQYRTSMSECPDPNSEGSWTTDNLYVNYFSTDNVKAGLLENNPDNYYLNEESFQVSPDGLKSEHIGFCSPVNLFIKDAPYYASSYITFYDYNNVDDLQSVRVYANLPAVDPHDSNVKLLLQSVLWCAKDEEVFPGRYRTVERALNGCLYSIEDGVKHYLPAHTSFGGGASVPFNTAKLIPFHQGFSYKADKKKGIFGDNCPINAVMVQNLQYPWSEDVMTSWSSCYVGRYGETRWSDDASCGLSMKFDGEPVDDVANFTPEKNGSYDFTITNSNIVVDGLSGKNTTVLHYDLTKPDNTPPTMQMMMFKNTDGYLTDRFSTGAEGLMEFSAAVFDYNIEIFYDDEGTPVDANTFYEYKPLNVNVEYSPYGKDEWADLEIEEIPELYSDQGWGYFFRASLKDVEGEAEKGWFDVRFTMSDEAGNTHVQTVSPAFRIDNLVATGVEGVGGGSSAVVGRYGLDGRRVETPQRGVNIVRLKNGEVRKAVVR